MSKHINPYRLFNGSIIPNWLMARTEINSSDKLVYARLGQFAGKKGVAFPCKTTLAKEIGLKPDYVAECLKKLAGLGLIEVTVRARADGPNRSNEYRFLDHSWINEEDEEDEEEGGGGAPPPPRGSPATPYPLPGPTQRGGPATPFVRESVEETHRRDSGEVGPQAALAARPTNADGTDIRERNEDHPDAEGTGSAPTDELEGSSVLNPDGSVRADRARAIAERQRVAGADKLLERKARDGDRKLRKNAEKLTKLKEAQEAGYEVEVTEGTPLGRLQKTWRAEFQQVFPDSPLALRWGAKQFGQAKQVLELYEFDQVSNAMSYLIHNWKAIRQKFFKGGGDMTPGVGVLTYFHESLVPNAAVWAQHREVLDRYAGYDPNPDVDRPKALRQEYAAARKELEALGL